MERRNYIEPEKQIKVLSKDILYYRSTFQPEELFNMFLEESKRCYYTALRFPSKNASEQEKKVQKQNYDYFIHTMADMMKKYAPEILN